MTLRILFPGIPLLSLIFGLSGSAYGEPFRGPWEAYTRTAMQQPRQAADNINPLRFLVKVHRDYISQIDGKTCPMHPSCSKYSLLCFEKHGLFVGWAMTCDRLLHEADEMRKVPVIYVNGDERFYDPVENNDFWWYREP